VPVKGVLSCETDTTFASKRLVLQTGWVEHRAYLAITLMTFEVFWQSEDLSTPIACCARPASIVRMLSVAQLSEKGVVTGWADELFGHGSNCFLAIWHVFWALTGVWWTV
jgi:hypothetical protein